MYKKKDFDFSKWGAFFAFGEKELKEQMEKHGITSKDELISLDGGLIAKKSNYKEMIEVMNKHYEEEAKKRIQEDGKDKVILYELLNYEAFYNYDLEDALEVLLEYDDITKEDVVRVFNENKEKYL